MYLYKPELRATKDYKQISGCFDIGATNKIIRYVLFPKNLLTY